MHKQVQEVLVYCSQAEWTGEVVADTDPNNCRLQQLVECTTILLLSCLLCL